MANNFTLAKNYTELLDEVYTASSVTADLTGDNSIVLPGKNANEILYPQISVSGLGDYDRNSGYTEGSVNLVWETAKFNYDRGTKILVDAMDDEETFHLAFGMAGSTLQREKVAPEADAFTFATLASAPGISTLADCEIETVSEFLDALIEAKSKMDDDEVPEDGRILYANSTLLNSLMTLDSFQSKEILSFFDVIKKVPKSRFYTAIDLLDGRSVGEELGHYEKSAGAKDINFMIVHKAAVIKFDKHITGDVIPPSINTKNDAYIAKYRKYGIVDVYKNKAAGIFLCTQ